MQHKTPWDSESPQIKVSMATHSLQIPRLSWRPQSSCRRFDLKALKGDPEDAFVPQIRIWVGDTNRKCHCAASSAALGANPDSSAFLKPRLCQNKIQLCSAEAVASPRTLPKSSGPVLADLLLIPFQGLTWKGTTMRALI